MENRVIEIIANYQGIAKEDISLDSNLIKDIGLSSFDVTEIVCKFEDEFGIEIPDRTISRFQTVQDIIEFIKNK